MPPSQKIRAADIKTVVEQIAPYLEDTSNDAPQILYFDGWLGLGAPAVLRAIAEQPPQSLREKFNKIIHIDCSIWKSRRALQRVIADELKLTQQVAAIDMEDEEDDFSGVDQGSRAEIRDITEVIGQYLVQYKCLAIFHNGSSNTVDLIDFGIPVLKFVGTKVLWTFRGLLRLNREIINKVDIPHLYYAKDDNDSNWNAYLEEEARDIALYTHKLSIGVAPKIAMECCLYLLSLNKQGKKIDYKWATHASCYWVCDGIIEGGQDKQAWEVAHALQQHIRLEDYTSNAELMGSVDRLDLSSKQWISSTESYFKEVPPEITTLFFAPDWPEVVSLSSDKFHKADQLRVLKLYKCTFSLSSPPFYCCSNLRFLGLDRCKDELQQGEEEAKVEKIVEPAVEIFQRLWVLDVCHTDWPLAFPTETEEQVVATDIREIHINNGRIWRNSLAWRRLPNLHKLRVVEPTNPWETATRDEFRDMVNLEHVDLSGNSTIQVLPSLSSATGLKTLVLDGCVGLEHVGPQGLPPSLESFSLDTAGAGNKDHKKDAKISYISLAGCARLTNCILRGSLPNLEELDLSHTAIKMLDLGKVDQVGNLERVLFMGCRQLCSISWPKTKMSKLRFLCIDTRAGGEVANRKSWSHDCSLMVYQQDEVKEYCHASIAVADMRFLQSLEFLWTRGTIQCDKWNLYLSSTTSSDDGRGRHKEKMGRHYSTGQLAAAPSLPNSFTYNDVSIEQMSANIDVSISSSSAQFLPVDLHMEIGEGISDVTNKSSTRARDAIGQVMNRIQSLHVHDSSSITVVAPEHIFIWSFSMNELKWCRVERCPKLDTVFVTNYLGTCFSNLEVFWASHLLMARSIWKRPRDTSFYQDNLSFTQLRAIHLHFCPRLGYVLPMASSNNTLSNNTLYKVLETLHIHCCGDLRQVFLVEQEFLKKITDSNEGMLEFSSLKSLYLYELPNLQQICEAKMFAPKLETIFIRGCWSLRRLPATDSRRRHDGRPVAVDCEKECWDKLEWDGMHSGHHSSLFEPSHSKYYRRRYLRGAVLR